MKVRYGVALTTLATLTMLSVPGTSYAANKSAVTREQAATRKVHNV